MAKLHDKKYFYELGFSSIKELETDQGILASSRKEIYGCIFGRDSLITALKLLSVYKKNKDEYFLNLVRKILINLALLQGKEINLESGEQPGKCIHEFRPSGHEHLTKRSNQPWYVYQDYAMRNYDSVDATILFLIVIYRFWQVSEDELFLDQIMPAVELAFEWIFKYGDSNHDGFLDYAVSTARTSGGLETQDWMDSVESVFLEDGGEFKYPLAPVEVQAYTYMALRLWAVFFHKRDSAKSRMLNRSADDLKQLFNDKFVTRDSNKNIFLIFKIDGAGQLLRSVRSNMGYVLWASLNLNDDGVVDSILEKKYVGAIVKRLLMLDMFEPEAGIRTLSQHSVRYHPNSYHNGSIWPHDNSLIAEGLEIYGYYKEAKMVRRAILKAIDHFKTPIELFVYDQGRYSDYLSDTGQRACKVQAWSAAAILDAAV
jgi:glycogen debranching enzyme